jgi:dephospho-CoA kinase
MAQDPKLQKALIALLGDAVYDEEGHLNRHWIATQVFADPDKLNRLNALVHPAVAADAQHWHMAQSSAYTLREAALLIESGSYKKLDRLIVVTAPEHLRILRVMQRDGATEAEVRARLNKQLPESDKVKLADFVIVNDGEQLLSKQVLAIHQALLQLAGPTS